MSNRYSIIRHWYILISGFINTVHYIFAIKHTGTALDDQIIFSKVIRKICSAYQTYIQFLSKTFFEHSRNLDSSDIFLQRCMGTAFCNENM